MKDIAVQPGMTIRQAMKRMSQLGEKCLVIVDEKNTLLGTLSDGDLRKAILNGSEMNDSIQQIYQSNPTVLIDGEYEKEDIKKIFTQQRFDLIPVVNNRGELIDIFLWGEILNNGKKDQKAKINVPVVIMAGGKGTRMEPFTKVLPKPLIPIHEKPIIEHIIERFTEIGCSDFYVTVNYKGKILKAYFEELQPEYDVSFVDENEPLGTAGSLQYLKGKFDKPFFVSNCDILVKTDYSEVANFHLKGKYSITIVGSMIHHTVPYGVCEIKNDGELVGIAEKPEYDYLINTGFYMMNPEVLDLIPDDSHTDMTSVIEMLKNNKQKVGVFPISKDSWYDVGEWSQYAHTLEKYGD